MEWLTLKIISNLLVLFLLLASGAGVGAEKQSVTKKAAELNTLATHIWKGEEESNGEYYRQLFPLFPETFEEFVAIFGYRENEHHTNTRDRFTSRLLSGDVIKYFLKSYEYVEHSVFSQKLFKLALNNYWQSDGVESLSRDVFRTHIYENRDAYLESFANTDKATAEQVLRFMVLVPPYLDRQESIEEICQFNNILMGFCIASQLMPSSPNALLASDSGTGTESIAKKTAGLRGLALQINQADNNSEYYQQYFQQFPDNFEDFVDIFGYREEIGDRRNTTGRSILAPLYGVEYQYIRWFVQSYEYVEHAAFRKKVFNLALNGYWQSDAVSTLRNDIDIHIYDNKEEYRTEFANTDKATAEQVLRFLMLSSSHHDEEEESIEEICHLDSVLMGFCVASKLISPPE